jgi:RHS repeat-associated protein
MRQSVTMSITKLRLLSVVLGLCVCRCSVGVAQAQTQDTVIYYHTDAIGSVRMITNANGQVISHHDYLPFGEPWTPPANADVRQFAGKERDAETGLDYFGARHYASQLGRFLTPDSELRIGQMLAHPQLWNKYSYVTNNPLGKIDPDGRWGQDVHYVLTSVLAQAAGFSLSAARMIAFADQRTDSDPLTEPMGSPWSSVAVNKREMFHFTVAERRASMWQAYAESGSLEQLGMFLHAEQDSWSHAGLTAKYGQLQAPPGLNWSADWRSFLPMRADRSAESTFAHLKRAAAGLGLKSKASWEQIQVQVAAANRSMTELGFHRAIGELCAAIDAGEGCGR